jgi:hypothetical protein
MLCLKKAQPNNLRQAIEHGEKALKIYAEFDDDIKYTEKIAPKITKIRYILADLYSYDIYNNYGDVSLLVDKNKFKKINNLSLKK